MQTLIRGNHARRKHPLGLLPFLLRLLLDHQIERPIQRAIQPLDIILLVRLRPSRHRLLHRHAVLGGDLLAVLRHPHLRIGQQLLHHLRPRRGLRGHQQLVVPRHAAARVVPANVLGGNAVALVQLDAPVQIGRGVLLEVKVLAEGGGQPLVEPLLVEVEGFFKGRQLAGEQGRASEDHAGLDAVDLRRGRGGGVGAC